MPLIDTLAMLGSGAPCSGMYGRPELLSRMDSLGITHAIVASSLACASDFVVGNAWLASQIEGERRLLGYAVVNTNHPPEAIECIRKYMPKRQFVGLILLEGDVSTPLSGTDAEEILNAHRRYGKPLLISCPNRACVHAAADIARKFPLVKVVLAGMGGRDWRSAVTVAAAELNVVLQTSGEPSPDKIREGWTAVKGNRIVFGSGSPLVDPAVTLGTISEVGLKQPELAQILFGNAERIFTG